MPANIEIKAALKDFAAAEAVAARLSGSGPEVLHQQDFFFRCDGARLKLRILAPDRGELIRYERPDTKDARCSRYQIARTSDPRILLNILTNIQEPVGLVKKTRTLYLVGQTRVHLDKVEGLGEFLELEVVLRPDQSEADGRLIAEALLAEFQAQIGGLIGEAYVDLLTLHA